MFFMHFTLGQGFFKGGWIFFMFSRLQQQINFLNSLSKLEKSSLYEWQVTRRSQHGLLLWNSQIKILYLELLPLMELCLETGH